MLKAPLIIGNDVSELLETAGSDSTSRNSSSSSTLEILSNEEVIAVNQDSLGRQARRVWSDAADILRAIVPDVEGRLIASKCASSSAEVEICWGYLHVLYLPTYSHVLRLYLSIVIRVGLKIS